jgi:transposase
MDKDIDKNGGRLVAHDDEHTAESHQMIRPVFRCASQPTFFQKKGWIFMQMQERAYTAEDVVRFLRLLLRKISSKLLVIWDGSPIRRAEVVKQVLSSPMGKRLHLERLPGSAPELNPQEQVWSLLKRRELKNLCCQNLAHLGRELVRAKERLRHRQEIL